MCAREVKRINGNTTYGELSFRCHEFARWLTGFACDRFQEGEFAQTIDSRIRSGCVCT